ncbi:ion channel [Lithospermum erythrorhizon]|uniref:Ion channel n=1 Tax=Lithospermum erythrorhizon TaxID=34254 RepID=A0AAV3RUV6_LITER
MENEPLLPISTSTTSRKPPPPPPLSLSPLPELNEFSPPSSSLTPSELKEYLIFGTTSLSPAPSNHVLDCMNFNLNKSISLDSSINNNTISSSPHMSPFGYDPSSSSKEENKSSVDWLVDPNYAWTKNHLHRSKTAPAMAVINEIVGATVENKPYSNSQSVVRQAVLLLMLYLSLGVVIYSCYREHFIADETHPVVDALYFCIVTMCTIGYGDITPATTTTKLFAIFFVLIGFGFIDILLSGMVSYVLDLQENYLLRTIKSPGGHDQGSYIIDFKKGRMRIRMKVGLALGVVVLCIGVGVAFLHFVERLDWLDSFYLSVMSVTTVGYGDRAFSSMTGRIFASIWLLVSTLAVARAFLFLAEARVDKRHRRIAKYVLGQDMTVSQFLAADIDNNGFVR